MEKLKEDNNTYITSFESIKKDIINHLIDKKKLNSPSKKQNFKTIENSSVKHYKKFSIKFPSIKPDRNNKISLLFDSNHKSINILSKKNLLDISHKNNKKIDRILSRIKNRKNRDKSEKYMKKRFNSNSNDKINRKHRYNILNNSNSTIEKNETNKIHIARSAKIIQKLHINNLVFNPNKKSYKINYVIPKSSSRNLDNSFSFQSQYIKPNLINKKQVRSIIDNFRKKEKQLEESKKQLFQYSLKIFSPRLLRKKDKKDNIKELSNIVRNNNDEKYKIKTMVFKNKNIPYIDTLDIRKLSIKLPPITLGSRYSIPEVSEEVTKRKEFNELMDKIIKEKNNHSHKNKINLTKKDILKKFRKRNLQFCTNRIHKTERDVYMTKNKIIKTFNILKLSLNQFDNWNSPENLDNLFN